MDIAPSAFSGALSAVLVGLGAGALLIGPLGDRFGRRVLIVGSLLLIAAATIGTAFSSTISEFVIWRFLTGAALGACLPNVTAATAEVAAPQRRAATIALISAGISIGAITAGLITPLLVRLGGWQLIFHGAGVFILLLAAVLFFVMPASEAATEKAESVAATRGSILAPLSARYFPATALFVAFYTLNVFVLYMIVSWLPHLLTTAKLSLEASSQLTAFFQGGGLVGGLLISWFIDRGRGVLAFMVAYGLAITAFVGTGGAGASALIWAGLLAVIGAGASGAPLAIMALSSSFYPAHVYSAAIGLAVAVGRLGAIAGPLVGGRLVEQEYSPQSFLLICAAPLLACMALAALSPRVKKADAA
jgi:AAHS family 4-hydroxybenzoate transporter-like MFS transporter